MTEEEAKTKWCSFTRVGVDNDPTAAPYNRLQEDEDGVRWPLQTLCIASACMAWRTRTVRTHVHHVTREGSSAAVIQPEDVVTLDGFCGLAGAPQ